MAAFLPHQETEGAPWTVAISIDPGDDRPSYRVANTAGQTMKEAISTLALFQAAPELYAACNFVRKYASMRASKGDPLPSQLVNAVAKALAAATP